MLGLKLIHLSKRGSWKSTLSSLRCNIHKTEMLTHVYILCRTSLSICPNTFQLWASCQIRKIAGYACAGNAGNVSLPPRVSDPHMHHGTCVTHEPWWMQESLTSGFLWSRWEKNVPDIPGAGATRNFTYLARGPWLCCSDFDPKSHKQTHNIVDWPVLLYSGRHFNTNNFHKHYQKLLSLSDIRSRRVSNPGYWV